MFHMLIETSIYPVHIIHFSETHQLRAPRSMSGLRVQMKVERSKRVTWSQQQPISFQIQAGTLFLSSLVTNTKGVTVFGCDGCAIRCISTCSISKFIWIFASHSSAGSCVLEDEGGGCFKIHIHHRCMLALNSLIFSKSKLYR